MGLLDLVDKVIQERGSSLILREHLNLLKAQAEALLKEKANLQDECARLKQRLAELERQVLAATVANEYVEHWGAAFKRKPSGGYDNAVFCRVCHKPMSSANGFLNYRCPCGIVVDFNRESIEEVRSGLPPSP